VDATAYSWGEVLGALVQHHDLTGEQAAWAMGEILSGAATPAQIAGLAIALRSKGETIDEVTGLLDAMYQVATPLTIPGRALDVVGTGGDRSMSVNISTMAAIVAAGAGARVVKHGNRSASSQAGSADVLEALGIRLDLSADRVARLAEQVGITFCFAAAFHPALRHAAVPRRELAIGTTFNLLGPLANPVKPDAQAVGCADPRLAPLMAGVLARRGVDAWVFRGDDGLDELTTTTTSQVWLVHDGIVTPSTVDPSLLGIATAAPPDLRGWRRPPQRRRRTTRPGRPGRPDPRRRAAQRRRGAGGLRPARCLGRGRPAGGLHPSRRVGRLRRGPPTC
jgi:anthranilate phosphoribosyltransferase